MHGLLSSPISDHAPWLQTTLPAQMQTGQLSPVSNGMDVVPAIEPSSGPAAMAAYPSRTDSWITSSTQGSGDVDDSRDVTWHQNGADDILPITKTEPMEEDINLDEVTEAPPKLLQTGDERVAPRTPKGKRPRGRPRKHPLASVASTSKITKGRSKTGCITCRKRKKKCDEAKPRCKQRISLEPPRRSSHASLSRHELRKERRRMRRIPREEDLEKWQGQNWRR